MRNKTRLAACALLSLLFIFGGVAVLRHADKRLPLNPIAAAETITAVENTRADTSSASMPDEATTTPRSDADTVAQKGQTEQTTAVFRGNAAVIGTEMPDGTPQLRPNGKQVGTGFDGETGSVSMPALHTPVFTAETTTAAPETTTTAETTTVRETTSAPSGGSVQPYRPSSGTPVAEPSTRQEPTTKPEEPTTEPEDNIPEIKTNLGDYPLLERSDISDVDLNFKASLKGDTDGYSLRVRLKLASDTGTGNLLVPEGIHYHATLPLGEHHFTLTICKDGKPVEGTSEDYTVNVVAKLATDEKHPVGKYPPVISTALDSVPDELWQNRFNLWVEATTGKGKPIYADHIRVTLDDVAIGDPTGSTTPTYELFFEAPNQDDTRQYKVKVLAWDDDGNSAVREYDVIYHHTSDGEELGEVTVILDATTVLQKGGVLDRKTITVHQGENAAQLLLRALNDLGYSCEYKGSEQFDFYLQRIFYDDMFKDAQVPDRLRELLLRDNIDITMKHDRDSLGEFDFTTVSGWVYSVNDEKLLSKGMDRTILKPGDTLRVCFTLSLGKDVSGYTSSDGDGLAGYCGIWRDGMYTPLEHTWSEPDEHGDVICTTCHEHRKEGDGT